MSRSGDGECLYTILGVARTATDDEIKRSYKKLALQYHPDKNPDDPKKAQDKFKRVSHAYSVLSDPKQKAEYDNPQPRMEDMFRGAGGGGGGFGRNGQTFVFRTNAGGFGGGGDDMDDLLRAFFGGGGMPQQRRQQQQQPQHQHHPFFDGRRQQQPRAQQQHPRQQQQQQRGPRIPSQLLFVLLFIMMSGGGFAALLPLLNLAVFAMILYFGAKMMLSVV
eukprot:PhM_4_TR14767/c0_g1_i1/m.18524